MELDSYRKLDSSELTKYPIVNVYHQLLENQIKTMPKGTWQDDENVIILIRYAFEIKLGLSQEEIPKITRSDIKENKLFGALNRFKSIRKLIHFVYPGVYHECDFSRVPVDYWSDINNIKERFEWKLAQEQVKTSDIPSFISYETLIQWGFANPLKRHGDSPFYLINAMYPNHFKETDFKKTPQHFRKNTTALKQQILDILQKEQIQLTDAPQKVTHKLLHRYHLTGVLGTYSNSISTLFCLLFPERFSKDDFLKPNGYWDDINHVRVAIECLLNGASISDECIPTFLTKKRLMDAKLGGLLHRFHGSPIEIVQTLYPGKFSVMDFQRVPNKFWHKKEHRVEAMRDFCNKEKVSREKIPLLNRAYFRKKFPRFISIADRHYDSKFYKWIMESFPEYNFAPEEFQLLVGEDGQICDSKEELVVHNFLIQHLQEAKIMREAERYFNKECNEFYIPDWIIEQDEHKYIVEYFGLYGSNLFPDYTEKTKRKMGFYDSIEGYQFIAIFPEDFKKEGFSRLVALLREANLY